MPSCFQLTRCGESSPSNLHDIDRAICHNCDIPFDDKKWAANWYNTIGLLLAVGKSFPEIADVYHDSPLALRIIHYLSSNYTSDAWRQHGWD